MVRLCIISDLTQNNVQQKGGSQTVKIHKWQSLAAGRMHTQLVLGEPAALRIPTNALVTCVWTLAGMRTLVGSEIAAHTNRMRRRRMDALRNECACGK